MKAANIDPRVWARLTARAVSGAESHAPLNDGSGRESSPKRSRHRYSRPVLLAIIFALGLIAISSLSLLQSPEETSVEMADLAPRVLAPTVPSTESDTAAGTTEVQQDPTQAIMATIEEWTQAWSNKNVERYLDCYSPRFEPSSGQALEAWTAQRRERLTRPGEIDVEIFDVEIEVLAPDRVNARFDQTFASPKYRDRVTKTLELAREDHHWKILREEARPPQPST